MQRPSEEAGSGTPTSTPVATAAPAVPDKTENRRSVIRIESLADQAKREEEERRKKRKEDEAKTKVEDERRKGEKARKEAEERNKMLHVTRFDEARVQRIAEKIAVDGDPLVAPKDKLLKQFSNL